MVSAISSVSHTQHVTQSTGTSRQKAKTTPESARRDSVELSETAQAALAAHQRASTAAAAKREGK
jgi:hypothetical protein